MNALRVLDASDNKLASIDDARAVFNHNMLSSLQLEVRGVLIYFI
jgi:hypothetical protein